MPEEQKASQGIDVKIGELLVAVEVVSTGDLQEAIQIAKRMNLPIGRVIVMSGVISEGNLQYALEAQSLVRDGLLDLDTAIQALRDALRNETTLQVALSNLRWAPKKDIVSNKLGELLVDSNMVTQNQLDSALQTSFDTGMPLGGTLVLQGVLSAQLLPMVLNAQEQIRDGKITRSGAVDNLKAALMYWAKADDSKTRSGTPLPGSQLESSAGSLSSGAYQMSSNASSAPVPSQSQSPYGGPAYGPPPQAVPGAVQAAQAQASAPLSTSMGLVDMMKMSGYCSDQEIQAAIERALANADIASKLFMATGLLSKTSFDNFLRCRALMVRGVLRPEQAIYALSACRIRSIALEDVFREMGVHLS